LLLFFDKVLSTNAIMATAKTLRRAKIKKSIRKKIEGTTVRPRLSVFRSNKSIYAQVIDDSNGRTLVSASSVEVVKDKTLNVEIAKEVGKTLAKKAIESGIQHVVFDRNGYLYHGRVKAFAEGAREGGLQF
jgi:large subunit ribosomal protein L18